MGFFDFEFGTRLHPSESYSRELDKRVAMDEKPYGYTDSPPPADTNNYDQRSLESPIGRPLRKK